MEHRPSWLLLALLLAFAGCPADDDDATGDDDTGDDDTGDDDTGDDDTGPVGDDDDTGDDDTAPVDQDGDGWDEGEDCDDTDPTVHPGAEELCDEIDHDCDGVADPGGCVTDSFVQEGGHQVDLLWVIEDSFNDFATIHDLLTVAAPALFDGYAQAGIDYHVAVVTTSSAVFVGDTPVVDPAAPDPVAAFGLLSNVGDEGDATERGIKFGYDALTMAANDMSPNLGFYRERAALATVYVSEEPDQSGSWATYWSNYQSFKPDPARFVAHAIVGLDNGVPDQCVGPAGTAWPGTGYADLVGASGGVLASVCEPVWTPALTALGAVPTSPPTWFRLSEAPVPSTIAVHVDGVPRTEGWYYASDPHRIQFDPTQGVVPPDGALVEVSYVPLS